MPNLKRMAAAKPVEWFAVLPVELPERRELTIEIFDVIGGDWFGGGVTAEDLIRRIGEAGELDEIKVIINSPGGDVMQGMAIYNYLRSHSARITVEIDGWAASIASVVAMAGDTIRMYEGSFLMIHNPWMMLAGNAAEFRAAAADLDKVAGQMVQIYKARTGQTTLAVETLLAGAEGADGTLMTAAEALEKGFATEVVEAKRAAAMAGGIFFDLGEDPEEKPAEDPAEDPEEKPADPEGDPADPEEKPADPEEKPADPEEKPADPEEDPEKKPEAQAAKPAAVGSLKALLPDSGKAAEPCDWPAAFEACGRDYVKARKRYPELYARFMKKR